MVLIHYGSTKYEPTKVEPIVNEWVKPKGGLWTSPVNTGFGWKEWCEAEDFRECKKEKSFLVELKDDARVLKIDSLEDLKKSPMVNKIKLYPDFELLAESYDAIWLTERGQYETRYSEPGLYGWDCESVLVMNPDCINELTLAN